MKTNKQWREYFQANLLDGDTIEESAGTMLNAQDVWEVVEEMLDEQRKEIVESVPIYVDYSKVDWKTDAVPGDGIHYGIEIMGDKIQAWKEEQCKQKP